MIFSQKRKRNKWKGIILFSLVTLYLVTRILAVFTPSVSGVSLLVDEMFTGNIAHDLDSKLVLYFPFYQTKPFAAGTVIEGIVAYPFMKILDHSLFALKCSAIFFNLLTMVLWFWLLWRNIGPIAAVFAGALFVFPPIGYLNLTITAWGNHTESSLFTVASLTFLFLAYNNKSAATPPTVIHVFLAGLIGGFGVYFAYTSMVGFIFGLLLIIGIGGYQQWKGPVWIYLGAGILGAMPFVASIRAYGLNALGNIDTYTGYSSGELLRAENLFSEQSWTQVPKKFFLAIFRDIPRSFCFPKIFEINGIFWSWGLYLFIIILFAVTVIFYKAQIISLFKRTFSGKKSRENVTVLLYFSFPVFILFYLMAFSFSGFRVRNALDPGYGGFAEFRYFAPIFPFLFAIAGISLHSIVQKLKRHRGLLIGLSVLSVVILIPFVQLYLGMSSGPHRFGILKIRGDYYTYIVEQMAMQISKHERQIDGKILWIENLPDQYKPILFEHLASINPSAFKVALILGSRLDTDKQMDVHAYRGWGRFVGRDSVHVEKGDYEKIVQRIFKKCSNYSKVNRDAFLEGAGEGVYFALQSFMGEKWHPANVVNLDQIWNNVPGANDRAAMMRGVGRGIGATFLLADLSGVEPEPSFWVGVGRQIRRNAKVQLLKNDMAIETIFYFPKYAIPWVLKGWRDEEKLVFQGGT